MAMLNKQRVATVLCTIPSAPNPQFPQQVQETQDSTRNTGSLTELELWGERGPADSKVAPL